MGEPEKVGAPPPYVGEQQQQATVVVTAGAHPPIANIVFKDTPERAHCPNCNNDVLSNVSFINGLLTWLVVGILLVMGFWLGCCLIPLCISSLKDVDHTCPVCNYHLGKYQRVK